MALGVAWVVSSACHPKAPPPLLESTRAEPSWDDRSAPATDQERETVLATARSLANDGPWIVGGLAFERDAVGFVRAAYWSIRHDLFDPDQVEGANGGLQIIWRTANARGQVHQQRPEVGDMVFLGPTSDELVHVLIVASTDGDGTITALGYFEGGVAPLRINAREDSVFTDARGRVRNDKLLPAGVAAGQWLQGFVDPWR